MVDGVYWSTGQRPFLAHPFIHLMSIYSVLSLCDTDTSHGYIKGLRQYKGNPKKHQIKRLRKASGNLKLEAEEDMGRISGGVCFVSGWVLLKVTRNSVLCRKNMSET